MGMERGENLFLYKKIADDIRNKITQGIYPGGTAIPEQRLLVIEYNASRVTIQKALNILKFDGLITSTQGSGTFVNNNANMLSILDNKIDKYVGFTKEIGSKASISSEIINFSVRFPNVIEQNKLIISEESPIYDIIRLRNLDDKPISLEYTIMPVGVIPNVSYKILQGSIYEYITETLKLNLGLANRRVHADKPNELDKEYLHCELTDPVLEVEQVVFLDSGIPFEYSKTRKRYDNGDIVMVQFNKA